MPPESLIRQRVNEVLSNFINDYPMCEKHREEILDITTYRMLKRRQGLEKNTIDSYVLDSQLRVDITVELTKLVRLVQGYPHHKMTPRKEETGTQRSYVTYDKTGKVIFNQVFN